MMLNVDYAMGGGGGGGRGRVGGGGGQYSHGDTYA